MLEAGTQVQEGDHELGRVLEKLPPLTSVRMPATHLGRPHHQELATEPGSTRVTERMQRAHSLPLHVPRYRRRWSSVGEWSRRENAPSTASFSRETVVGFAYADIVETGKLSSSTPSAGSKRGPAVGFS
jgi:hypothetical protein